MASNICINSLGENDEKTEQRILLPNVKRKCSQQLVGNINNVLYMSSKWSLSPLALSSSVVTGPTSSSLSVGH